MGAVGQESSIASAVQQRCSALGGFLWGCGRGARGGRGAGDADEHAAALGVEALAARAADGAPRGLQGAAFGVVGRPRAQRQEPQGCRAAHGEGLVRGIPRARASVVRVAVILIGAEV